LIRLRILRSVASIILPDMSRIRFKMNGYADSRRSQKVDRRCRKNIRSTVFKAQGGARAGPGGTDPLAMRMPGRIRPGEEQMLRKMMIALAASGALALAMAPTDASARMGGGGRGGGGGFGHGGFAHGGFAHGGFAHGGFARGGFRHGGFRRFGFRGGPFFVGGYYPYYYGYGGCWRWVPGPWGLRRVWVCGYGYY
jgi:hypothetical protein